MNVKINFIRRLSACLLAVVLISGFSESFKPAEVSAQMSYKQMTGVNAVDVQLGSYNTAILDDEGRVWTFGNNTSDACGRARGAGYDIAGQVTDTITAGVQLPFITQISGSVSNFCALDRSGQVWSWGYSASSALGRSGANDRPGKVDMPNGITAKWIAAGYYGGGFVGSDGSLYVWGYGYQNGIGTGNNTNLSIPTKLTLDNSGSTLPSNFIKMVRSDYYNYNCGMGLTADGNIYTWGNDNEVSSGGSLRPKLVQNAAFVKEKEDGSFVSNVKKIDCSNGAFAVLTYDGELYTWGDDARYEGHLLGLGSIGDRPAPQKVTMVNNGVNNNAAGNSAVPVIRDVSYYAWSAVFVDWNGNVYAMGQFPTAGSNGKHGTTPTTSTNNYQNLFTKRTIASVGQISSVSEGYYECSYLDVYGNVSVYGTRTSGCTTSHPYINYQNQNAALFTSLTSTPSNEVKSYTRNGATLNATTNISANEVKYVVLYPNEAADYIYSDGESYYEKSFFELDLPYYNKGTDPLLLLSPAADLPTSSYYANPKISEAVFDAAYAAMPDTNKGTINGPSTNFTRANVAQEPCIVWVQSKTSSGITNRLLIRFDHIYTKTSAWFMGVKKDDPSYVLYPPELIPGDYGMLLDRNGQMVYGDKEPPLGWDVPTATPKVLDYWSLDPAGQEDSIVLDDVSKMGDEITKQPRITFTYSKKHDMWQDMTIHYVDTYGNPVNAGGVGSNNITDFAPIGVPYPVGEAPYIPPHADISTYDVVGYKLSSAPDTTGSDYTVCSFPDGFTPTITTETDIYIVYKSGMKKVTETYWDISNSGSTQISNNSGILETVKNIDDGAPYTGNAPNINEYITVGYKYKQGTEPQEEKLFNWDPIACQYTATAVSISAVGENTTVEFLYKLDRNGNKIPDEEEGVITVNWVGYDAYGSRMTFNSKNFYGNVYKGDKLTVYENKEVELLPDYDPDEWIFVGEDAICTPPGSDSPITNRPYTQSAQSIYFYYDEDSNKNGIPDKDEGIVIEKFKLYSTDGASYADLVPPVPDIPLKYMEGDTYGRSSSYIEGYICYAYDINGIVTEATRIELENGSISPSFKVIALGETVTYLYKIDANKNNIPDDMEANVTAKWVAVTAGGSRVTMNTEIFYGFDGDSFTVLESMFLIDPNAWIFYDIEADGVSQGIANNFYSGDYDKSHVHVIEFLYDEDVNGNHIPDRLEPILIVVKAVLVDSSGNPIADAEPLYQYTRSTGYAENPFDIDAMKLPTYRTEFAALIDKTGHTVKSKNSVTIVPRNVNTSGSIEDRTITVTFRYVSNMDEVTIKSYYRGTTTPVEGSTDIKIPAEIGTVYTAAAPVIIGYTNVGSDPADYRVTVTEDGANLIIFYYEKDAGNLTISAVDSETSAVIGTKNVNVQKNTSFEATDSNAPTVSDIPALSDYVYVNGSGTPALQTFDGVTPLTPVTYKYTRIKRNVKLVAIDTSNGNAQIGSTYSLGAYGVGLTHNISAPSVAMIPELSGYVLADMAVKAVLVSNEAGDLTVYFNYVELGQDSFKVISFYDINGNNIQEAGEATLIEFEVDGENGSEVIISHPTFAGYTYTGASPTQTGKFGTTTVLYFGYNKDELAVTYQLVDESNAALPAAAISGIQLVYYVPRGLEYTAHAPNVAGYTLVDTQDKNLGVINEAKTVKFVYRIISITYTNIEGRVLLSGKHRNNDLSPSYVPDYTTLDEGIKVELFKITGTNETRITNPVYTNNTDVTSSATALNYSMPVDVNTFIADASSSLLLRFTRVGNNGVRDESYLCAEIIIDISANNTAPSANLTMPEIYLIAGAFVMPGADKQQITPADVNVIKAMIGGTDTQIGTDIFNINEYLGVDASDYATTSRFVGRNKNAGTVVIENGIVKP